MKTDASRLDKSFVRRGKLRDQGNDYEFWKNQPYEARIAAVEEIRREYNTWKYGSEQGFQRVYRVVKRKQR